MFADSKTMRRAAALAAAWNGLPPNLCAKISLNLWLQAIDETALRHEVDQRLFAFVASEAGDPPDAPRFALVAIAIFGSKDNEERVFGVLDPRSRRFSAYMARLAPDWLGGLSATKKFPGGISCFSLGD